MLDYCKTCFHVEFCVQDAKQFTELTDCQSRDLDKLYFHFNTTLTSGNLAKTEAHVTMRVLTPHQKLQEEEIRFYCYITMLSECLTNY